MSRRGCEVPRRADLSLLFREHARTGREVRLAAAWPKSAHAQSRKER